MTLKYAKPELLSPAGTLKNMRYAFAYGADAVYAGQPRYSLRVRNNEFNHANLKIAIDEAHQLGKKFYVVVNIAPHNSKLKTFIKDLQVVVDMKPDALIMSDWATVKFWKQMGLTRVILSRELSLEEIEEIRQHVPDIELEIFVHGALCMAYSGRCLLSGYINKRDPNQGTCTNACRWEYKMEEGTTDEVGNIVPKESVQKYAPEIEVTNVAPTLGEGTTTDKVFLYTEPNRPDEQMTAFEDEHGTYFMNSKDLRAVQHVERLTQMGVHSLKIEGRTKSFYYCARTAQVYRKAIDDAAEGKPFDTSLLDTLESLAHRGYTEGFLRRHTHDEYQNYEYGYSISERQQFVGEFTGKRNAEGMAEVAVKNKFLVGDSVEMMTPKGNVVFKIERMLNRKNESVEAGLGDGHFVFLDVPADIELDFALLMRNLTDTNTRNPHKG